MHNSLMDRNAFLQELAYYKQSSESIPIEKVLEWMETEDLGAMGAVSEIVTLVEFVERINTEIDQEILERFLYRYYERCLIEDPEDDYADNRYETCRSLLAWFQALPKDVDPDSNSFIVNMKYWMEEIYRRSDQDIRKAITYGALEHILEQERWQKFFSNWKNDPVLAESYDSAMEWAIAHQDQDI